MNIKELSSYEINPAIAYALGLIYPLYKEKKLNAREYILGCINHNPGKVTQNELNEHYRSVIELFSKYIKDNSLLLKTNKCEDYTISPKLGFTVLIEKTGVSTDECLKILTEKVQEIKKSSRLVQQEFVKGCFDGRASWDTTAHFLSIDVDRNYERQNLVIEIINSLDIKLNVNRRALNHDKNDQLRIKLDSLHYFLTNIGLYSTCRIKIIDKALRLL